MNFKATSHNVVVVGPTTLFLRWCPSNHTNTYPLLRPPASPPEFANLLHVVNHYLNVDTSKSDRKNIYSHPKTTPILSWIGTPIYYTSLPLLSFPSTTTTYFNQGLDTIFFTFWCAAHFHAFFSLFSHYGFCEMITIVNTVVCYKNTFVFNY